mgnify:CR=1 FL=1
MPKHSAHPVKGIRNRGLASADNVEEGRGATLSVPFPQAHFEAGR